MHFSPARLGFSLMEIALALVIIGLTVGGVLVGQEMLRNSEVRSVITEYQGFQRATDLFVQQYEYLPGDLPTAGGTNGFWPVIAQTGTADNGDGDGNIDIGGSYEDLLAWRELALAELIPGSYTGAPNGASPDIYNIGSNIPAAKLPGAGWAFFNTLWVAGKTGNATLDGGVLTAEEARSIDNKIDDTDPTNGTVIGADGDGTSCISGSAYFTPFDGILRCYVGFVTGY